MPGEASEQDVREKAYDIWLHEGKPEGRDIVHWEMARQALVGSSDIPVQTQAKGRAAKTTASEKPTN